jgi:uncharacterized membrane protein YphA (DoxX/SURF4 family)
LRAEYSLRRLVWAGPLATLFALVANFLFYTITKAAGEQYLIPLDGSTSHIGPMPVLLFVLPTLIVGVVASVFFGLLIRFSRLPAIVFLSVAVAALILSLGGPGSLPDTSLQTQLLLTGMNLLTAICLTGGILLLSRDKKEIR